MLKPDYPIITERLLLRPLDAATDVDAVHAYQSSEDACRYIPYTPRTREEVAERLADPDKIRSTLEEEGQALQLAIVLRETGDLIGDGILFWRSVEHQCGEIGYIINPEYQGNGYATEAGRVLLSLAFDGLNLHRVIARVDLRNPASARVLSKLGMRQEAVLIDNEWFKGEWSSEIDFAILQSEWQSSAS